MRSFLKLLIGVVLLFGIAEAQMFQSVPQDKAELLQKGESKEYCPSCGMYLPKFYKTNHAAQLKDGTVYQFCSIHCLVEEMEFTNLKGKKGTIKEIMVVDVPSLKFTDAKKAYYVIGSDKPGTMSMVSTYAFKNRADAEKFAKENGGKVTDFEKAYAATLNDFNQDKARIKKMRGTKMYGMGEKIYEGKCDKQKLDSIHAHDRGELKAQIKDSGVCGKGLNDMQLQAVMLYYWDVKLNGTDAQAAQKIDVPKDAKCPVCGMFVAKYPKWAAVITMKDGHKHYFDGVKDMMKYYFDPKKYHAKQGKDDFASIQVSDYYTLSKLDGTKAFYVVGSNVYGPMGNELIPFSSMDAAKDFSKAHAGKKILKFDEINAETVDSLDK